MTQPTPTEEMPPIAAQPSTCVKMSYPSKKAAQTAANWRLKARGRHRTGKKRNRPERLRIYFCEPCEAWHLTHTVNTATAVKNNWFKKRIKTDFIDDPAKVAIRYGWKPNDEL